MKFICSICNGEVRNISICKKYVLRDDYTLNNSNAPFTKADREYLDVEVLNIIYKCNCGEMTVEHPAISDFCRDSETIWAEDIKQQKYGTLIVVKN